MTFSQALSALFHDMQLQAALCLIAVDLVLGVLAALRLNTFRLSYLGDFGRNDIAYKLVPWACIYIAARFAGHQQLLVPHVDLGDAAGAAYAVMVATWAGSILNSLNDLGLKLPAAVAGAENQAPPKD